MLRHEFFAMGTTVELLLDGEDASRLTEAEREFHRLEGLLSRFLPGSELSRLNAEGELVVGPELLDVVDAALEARERTGGRFDPTVHNAVVAAGYDRSFERIEENGSAPVSPSARATGRVDLDPASGRVSLEPGYRLDLGGIAKGWAADRAHALLREVGPALVNAGGDIALSGREWPVAVETPRRSLTLGISSGGVATSGRDRRTWVRGGQAHHHLIDPATGLPGIGDVLTVTVAAATATEAEVLAKALFLAGDSDRALEEADAASVPAVLVTTDGDVRVSRVLR